MCIYETLSYDEKYGYMIYCSKCKNLQLGFSCLLVNFDMHEFRSFRRMVSELYHDFEDQPLSQRKVSVLPSPYETMCLYLSVSEIHILHRLIDEADSALQARSLIGLFSQTGE